MPTPLPPTGPTRSVGIALERELIDLIDRLRTMGDGPPASRSEFVRGAVHLWSRLIVANDPRVGDLLDEMESVLEDAGSSPAGAER